MKSRKHYFGLIMMIYFILFSAFSVTLAQDCQDCTTEEVGTSVHSKKPFPLDGDKNSGSSQLSQNSIQTSSLERANESLTSFVGNYIFRYVYPTWFNTDINNPIVYTSDEQICFRTYSTPVRRGDWFSAKIIFPDGSEIRWQKITWKGNRWYDENGNELFDGKITSGGVWSELTAGVQCKPEGEWIINLYHNTYASPAVTKIVTCKGGAGPDVVKQGEDFRQGKYNNEKDETHHMDNACRFPDDKVSHFCSNPLAVNEAGETEYKVLIRQIGCALTSCTIMLNYHGIDVKPPALNTWLKNRGYYYDDNGTKKWVCTGYAPVANINWNAVALYGYSNGVFCFYDGLINNAERIKDYICRYGPQIMGVAGSSGVMNTHWVCVYAWESDKKGNVIDWLIVDPATGKPESLKKKYGGCYGDVHGFRFIRSSTRINASPSITFNMHSPAELLVIDSQGRRTGYDPATGQNYNEIPEASYIHHVGIEDPETGELYESDLKTLHILNPDPEKYKLVVTGTGNGTYSLDVMGYNQSYTETVKSYEDIPVTPLEVHTYEIQYDGYVDRFEAEAMNLYNYLVEDNPSASGEKLVKVTANPASASFVYSGDPGVKDLAIWYYDQNNGHSTYQLYINNVLIDSWTADRDLGSAEVDATTRVSRVVSNIQLNTGDQIKIEGLMYGEEYAAIDSVEISKSLETLPRVAPLSFTLASGVYDSPQSVAIICDSGDAVIRYTTNGTTPNQTSPVYNGPIEVTSSMTLKAYASKNGFEDSEVISANYTITNPANRVAAPTFTPVSGNYTFGRKVSIISATAEATIRYTTDGSIPNASSPVYTGPIVVDQTTTIKAYASKDGVQDSTITTAVYTIKVMEPVFTPASGTYLSDQLITITCPTRDAVIRYTTDGSMPNASSPIYIEPIRVERNTTIRAYASITGLDNSDIVSANYVIKVDSPKLSLKSGTYYSPQSLTISCANPNATIHYTTDGSAPNASSPVYTGPITVDRTMTIKAWASLAGFEDSDIVTANYTLKVPVPIFSPETGIYDPGLAVTIFCATTSAIIRYTIDNDHPDDSSPVYTEPIILNESTTIKACAVKDGWQDSDVATAVYGIKNDINALNLALGRSAIASSVYYDNAEVAEKYAVDGDMTTYWASHGSANPQWIMVDLGSVQNINNVKLWWKYYAKSYQIQTSTDELSWTDVYATTNGDGSLDDISFSVISARYVRVYMTKAQGSGFEYSIREFEIYNYTEVPDPVFTPVAGAYTTPQAVAITCPMGGTTIYYTTDGSAPNSLSSVYSGPIMVSNTILKAYAVKEGLPDSNIVTAIYSITSIPDNIINGDFESGPGVGWTEYALNGHRIIDQSRSHNGLYSARLGGNNYAADDYIEQQIEVPEDGAVAFWWYITSKEPYTLDRLYVSLYNLEGMYLTTLGSYSAYNSPLPNAWSKAVLSLSEYGGRKVKLRFSCQSGSIYNMTCWIDDISIFRQAERPTFTPEPGVYESSQMVTINSITDGATIYYTVDGSDPTSNSTVYTGPIQVSKPTTIKAYVVKAGILDSEISTATYDFKVAAPTCNLESGVYSSAKTLILSCDTDDVVIHFTLDGSTPSETSPVYSGPINLLNTAMIKAYAVKKDFIDSDIITVFCMITATPNSITNFDFENGPGLGWTGFTADGHISIDQNWPHTGSYSAQLGNYNNANDYIEQQVIVPPNAILSYWRYMETTAFYYGTEDFLEVCLYDTNGVLLETLRKYDYWSPAFTWVPDAVNLSSYAGQRVILRFSCKTDDLAPCTFWLDNVSINSLNLMQTPKPIITPIGGKYLTEQKVSISCPMEGATIRYTIDGSIPTDISAIYHEPVTISNTTMIRAYAVKEGLINSNMVMDVYNIASTPNLIVNSDFEAGSGVGWNEYTTSDRGIIDQTRPHTGYFSLHLGDNNSNDYIEQQVIIPSNAVLTYWQYITSEEDILSEYAYDFFYVRLYKVDGTLLTTLKSYSNLSERGVWIPEGINLAAYAGQQVILRFSCITDNSLPTEFWIDNVSINSVMITPSTVATPNISPIEGMYTSAQSIIITCDTDGATIRYTIDGSDPNSSSPVYTGPLMISKNTTIKAYATKTGMSDSEIATVTYKINLPQVATPVFSPEGGSYTEAQSISISCATTDAIIRYTIDGSVPNASSLIYNGPILINTNTTIKAYAYKTGMIDSETVTVTYMINDAKTVATPTFLPDSGTYYWSQIVKIFCPTKGAIIRYTTDGSVPDSTSRIYTHPIMVTKTTTIKAYAVKPGFIESNMAAADYEMKTATPFFSLKPGIYKKPQKVKIHCPTKGAVIRYTTDGSEPNHRSPIYFHPIILKDPTTIKAYAYKHGYSDSEMITATYIINNRPKTATPIFSPGSGTRMSSLEIRITCKTKGAIIRYTTDGTEPDPSSPIYTGPLKINKTTTVKAYAAKEGHSDSGIATAYYGIMVAPPVFNPKAGSYHLTQKVKISCATNGAIIRYTIDGSTPNDSSAVYKDPILVTEKTTIKAYASKSGCKNSIIVNSQYFIRLKKWAFRIRTKTRYITQKVISFVRKKGNS